MNQLSLRIGTATERKRMGQDLAEVKAGREWQQEALVQLKSWLAIQDGWGCDIGPVFTFDQFRESGFAPEPVSVNAWGTLPRAAVKAGICRATDRTVSAHRPESHGRLVRLWRALG